MTISEFSNGPVRKQIGFVRELPSAEIIMMFKERGYNCVSLDAKALLQPGLLSTTDSIVISQNPSKFARFKRDLDDLGAFANALDYDCRLYVRYVADDYSRELVLDSIDGLRLPFSGLPKADMSRFSREWFDPSVPSFEPLVSVLREDEGWPYLANLIVSNPAGRAPNPDLQIIGLEKYSLGNETTLLFQRAFADCSSIELRPKANGKSGVGAFEAFAHPTDLVGSQAPYRCFLKLGSRVKVGREFEKYCSTALENIPFHLGPRIRADRCVLGKSLGLITCDYVGGAEVLRDCVRDGRAIHVIGNLFNQTLISWRRAATVEQRPLQDFLVELLSERILVPEHRKPAIEACGSTKTLEELKTLIMQAPPSLPVLSGVVHGDLHATNVLVRMNDAIIVDLERIASGQPLLIDAASLEGGLFVDGFVGDDRSADDVLNSLMPFYSADALKQDDHHCHPSDRSAWFVDSIRQVRMQARQMEQQPYQYGWTLAAVLLKKATNPEVLSDNQLASPGSPSKLTPEKVRAMAFALAERIILELSKSAGTRPS